ncbi:MAG: LytTR family transcriptional regulator DNA-binding domain-containing protein [Thomasclavelia sp.]|uniref:LytTR family transcriptional regulator DNA-binding domain-containing protein n=1 Tax=Thomasclavelia sp. TaxID=3025757 RepID=UPI0039A1E878
MITIAIIDNDQYCCDKIKNILLLNFDEIRTYTYNSVYQIDKEFDFLLLNMNLPDCNGIEYAKANEDKKIIFISNYDDTCKKAFGPNIYGFIDTDNLEEELIENISRIKIYSTIELKIDGQIVSIKIDKIIYCMYLGSMNVAITYDDRYIIVKNTTLKKILNLLGDDFMYINRNIIINKNKVSTFSKNGLYLKGINTRFDVSRRQKKLLLKILYD